MRTAYTPKIRHCLAILAATLLLLPAFQSCSKSGMAEFSDLAVVESYLSPGAGIRVLVSRKTPYDAGAMVPAVNLDALEVVIGYGGNQYTLVPLGYGVYADTARLIKVLPDSSYTLELNYNGVRVSSSTLVPSRPSSVTQSATSITMAQFDPENPSGTSPPSPVVITFANADASYYVATVECIDTTQVPVYKDSVPANDILSSQPVTGTEIEIHPMSIRYFGMNRIILYHINPEYSTFFMRQSSSSQNYQEPPSNIVNGLGIFTGINADTLYLEVIQAKK